MKVTNLQSLVATQTEMAKALGITQQRVSQLLQDGVLFTDGNGRMLVVESIKNFYKTRTQNDSADIDINKERAKFERARRVLEELKVAKAMRKVYDARTVELVMTEELSTLRTQLLGLPTKLAPLLEGKTREQINEILTREIEGKLAELSEYSPEVFDEEVEDDEGSNEDS